MKKIVIGSRSSPLAKVQVQEILELFKRNNIELDCEIKYFQTQGDLDKKKSLMENSIDDFFTDTLDQALMNGEIDLAIHSAKDLPKLLNEKLSIFALTRSVDDTDAFVGKQSFYTLKPGARVGTSSDIRKEGLNKLNPAINTVDIRGTIQERLKQLDEGKYDGIIVATIALKRLGLENRVTDIMPWESTPLQGSLAIVGREECQDLHHLFTSLDARNSYGKVTLVGAGPGDPELITLKGIKALENAECIFYDFLINKELLKHAQNAEQIYVGKRKGQHILIQSELSNLLRDKAMEGKNIVRLKGGDPLVFGRGGEEIEYLRRYHIHVDVIPGVSSATAVASRLGIPLTARDISSSVAFVSGHSKDEKDGRERPVNIPNTDTIVFFMALTKIDRILESLDQAGWAKNTPIIVISRGTWVDESVICGTLENILDRLYENPLKQPALIIVGQTVNFYQENKRHKRRILYTGTNPDKYSLFGKIIHFPMIEIVKAQGAKIRVQEIVDQMNIYDMILLTSRFSVKYFFEILKERDFDLNRLKSKRWIVIGRDTANALTEFDFFPDLVAVDETSAGLFSEMEKKCPLKGKTILFPRSSLPNLYLKEHLEQSGAKVDQWAVYENVKPTKRVLPKESIEQVIFTSPSTVRNFLEDYKSIPKEWSIFAKGKVTKNTLEKEGYKSEVYLNA